MCNSVVYDRLERYLRDDLGVDAQVTHRWVGIVGYTADQRPYVGGVPDRPGLYVMGGYCGTGNVTAWVGGRIVADLIVDGSSPDETLFDAARAERPRRKGCSEVSGTSGGA